MQVLLSLALLFSLSYDALAAPTPALLHPTRKSKSFRVERAKRSNYVAHGPNALSKAYCKFGITAMNVSDVDTDDFLFFDSDQVGTVPVNEKIEDSAQTGAVSATPAKGGAEFVSPVLIGNQSITLDFDTGSADMYVTAHFYSYIIITLGSIKEKELAQLISLL